MLQLTAARILQVPIGARPLLRVHRSDTLVLCFHAVSSVWDSPLAVTPSRLEEQVEILVERGYRGVTFSEAVLDRAARGRRVAVTFDDACMSIYARALPILTAYGLPATVFVPTAFPDEPHRPMSWPGIDHWVRTEHRDELLPMSWDMLRAVRRAGWEVGSHTVTHPHLTRIEEEALVTELGNSRQRIEEELGEPCRALAYPYGDTDTDVESATAQAGYSCAAALPGDTWSKPSAHCYPRVGIYRGDSMATFKRKISPSLRFIRYSRAWPCISIFARMIPRPG